MHIGSPPSPTAPSPCAPIARTTPRGPTSSARTRSASSGRRCRSRTRTRTPAGSSPRRCRRAGPTESSWGFAVEVDGRYAGTVELRDEGEGRVEVAYGSHPWVRGTGAMTRAVRLLVDWAFTERDARVVVWRANKGNWASRKLAWRLGFTLEGTIRAALPQRGELRDAWVGTLLATDDRAPEGDLARRTGARGRRAAPATVARLGRAADRRGLLRCAHADLARPMPDPVRRAGGARPGSSTSARTPPPGDSATWAVVDPARTWLWRRGLLPLQPGGRARDRLLGPPGRSWSWRDDPCDGARRRVRVRGRRRTTGDGRGGGGQHGVAARDRGQRSDCLGHRTIRHHGSAAARPIACSTT